MGEKTKIAWCHHTFNPWRGCTKIAAGCANCYAERFGKRQPELFGVWGNDGMRVIASAGYWNHPLRWNHAAEKAGERRRVFCGSLMDFFEHDSTIPPPYRENIIDARIRVLNLIAKTPWLDWLLLTKRIENVKPTIRTLLQETMDVGGGVLVREWLEDRPPANVWLGYSASTQEDLDRGVPYLLKCPAAVRFLSIEPLLGPLQLAERGWLTSRAQYAREVGLSCLGASEAPVIDWVIVGGESGPGARPCNVAWIRSVLQQCQAAGVPCFVKQLGADVRGDWEEFRCLPNCPMGKELLGCGDFHDGAGSADVIRLVNRKGGNITEWPEDLRVRELTFKRVQQ